MCWIPSEKDGSCPHFTHYGMPVIRILGTDFADFSHSRIKQHDINMVVQFRLRFGAELPESVAFHQNPFPANGSTSKGSPK